MRIPDETVECPVGLGLCPELPLAGPDGFVRHLLAVHPESLEARSIFTRLVEVQLLDTTTAATITVAEAMSE